MADEALTHRAQSASDPDDVIDAKTNEAFLLEWEPDPTPTPTPPPADDDYVAENTNNNAVTSEPDGAQLSTISLPNETEAPRLPSKQQPGQLGSAYSSRTAVTKMSVADVDCGVSAEQLEEYRRQQQEARDREPLRFCRWIAEKPGLFFGLTLSGHLLFILITGMLIRSGYDILPVTFDRLPLDIRDDVDYLRGLAWSQRNDDANDIIKRVGSISANQSERSQNGELLQMVFQQEGGNVFTQENLKLMKTVEDDFYNNPEFQNTFCLLNRVQACSKARSILRYFDGTYKVINSVFEDPGFNNIQTVLYTAMTNNMTKQGLQYHLGKDAVIDATKATSQITRGYLLIGMPLAGYSNSSDREKEQEDKIKKFMLDEFKVKAEGYYKSGVGAMKFIYFSPTLLGLSITSQVFKDMALAVGSLLFIILFVCIQTGSLWVGLFAIFSVIASFTEANMVYRVLLDFRYFGIFHVLAIFIILGIGADDVFVFYDTWKETAHHPYKSLSHRLSDCYRKASFAMLFTSLTTGIAFAISASSPFLGISSFGVFACILIFVDYISVIVFFPCVVVTYHLWWEKYKCCCCCTRPIITTSTETEDRSRKNIVVRFFAGPYYRFITHKVLRWFILLFFATLLGVSIYFASTLKVNEDQVEFLPKSSNFGQYLSLSSNAFTSTSETGSSLLLTWGLKPQDLSSCHKTDPTCTGTTQWDDTFNMNSADAQNKLLALCNDLKSLNQAESDALSIRRNLVTDVPEVQCFVDDMQTFYAAEGSRTDLPTYPAGTSFPYPIDATEVDTIMTTNSFVYNKSALPATFDRNFEIATSFWLFNGFRTGLSGFVVGPQLSLYNTYLGETKTSYSIEKTFGSSGSTYTYGTQLRYAAIIINTTIVGSNFGFPRGLPIRKKWEDYITRQMAVLPTPLKGGFQILMGGSLNIWHWFKVQKTLADSAIMGVGIGIAVACPILIVATHNVFVGLLATFTICCITCSVIAVIPLGGWKLGVLESLNLVLVVGLAVDYVVHLAEGYSRSIYKDRKRRTQTALEEVGISVLSGAITTLGASAFLLGAFILFFTQFGVFMFSTIGLSITYALGMFTTLIAIIGPEGEMGSLRPLWRWCAGRCCSDKSSQTTPDAGPPEVKY